MEDRFERLDCCASCEREREPEDSSFATWRSIARGAEPTGPRHPEPELLLELLRRLLESAEPDDTVLASCLALYLARKKRLKRSGISCESGGMKIEYRETVSGEIRWKLDESEACLPWTRRREGHPASAQHPGVGLAAARPSFIITDPGAYVAGSRRPSSSSASSIP